MATAHHALEAWGLTEAAHPVLAKSFTPDELRRLIREDLVAGRNVSLELVAVVALGLLIGVIAVLSTL
jgi:hypothetical protein